MVDHNHSFNVDLMLIEINERLDKIEKRLDNLEEYLERKRKLNNATARAIRSVMSPEEIEQAENDAKKLIEEAEKL